VGDLLTLYGVTDSEERAALLNLAREANTPGWWHAYSDVLPSWLEPYVGLEAAASVIRTYEVQLVPGLLQTEGYARTLIRQGSAASEDEIARRGELRASRQEILRRPDAPQLWAVVDEGALRRRLPCRSCRSWRARTRPWAARSRSCASPSPTCMTSCTSSS
jgi:hypothetical protein